MLTPDEWVALLGAVAVLLGALAAAIVSIVKAGAEAAKTRAEVAAMRAELEHARDADAELRRLQERIDAVADRLPPLPAPPPHNVD